MAVLLLAVCLISQLRLAGRERQRRAAQQDSVEQLLAAAPEGILRMRGTVDTCSTTEESTSVVLRALAVEAKGSWLRLDVPAHGAGCTIKKNGEALLPGDEIEIKERSAFRKRPEIPERLMQKRITAGWISCVS